MSRTHLVALVSIAAALAACGEARRVTESADALCGRCHHGTEPGAGPPPPGAHPAHLRALGAGACEACHPDPRLGSPAHRNGRVEVAFGPLATGEGALSPALDPATLRCAGVYCHGAFAGGNEENTPAWTSVGEGAAGCGTCHALPTPRTHAGMPPDPGSCGGCHAATVDARGQPIAAGAHLNGRVEGVAGACTACHPGAVAGAGARSRHLGEGGDASGCRGCHESVPQGHFASPAPDVSCRACHDGSGEVLGGRTPPLLVGWGDTAIGDWHGARAGSGYGGTLKAPYARGEGPLPCTACHDPHSSANGFLLASTVNGTAIPPGAIDRAGVGAEAFCSACHDGARHGGCLACHLEDPVAQGNACFRCHGHEGIRFFTPATPAAYPGCCECHYVSLPAVERAAPVLGQAPAPSVSGITATAATVRWSTDEEATSWVEYGAGAATSTAGDGGMTRAHVVTLTGLAPSTTYVWRVRSSDPFRNVTVGPLSTFGTPGPDEVPRPDLAVVLAGTTVPSTTTVARLLWYPVAAPSGTAVEYEVQLASDPGFTRLENANLARADATLATGNSGWIAGAATNDWSSPPRPALGFDVELTNLPQDSCSPAPDVNVYYFRVRARDQTGKVSEWSTVGSFGAMAGDEWC